MVQAVERKFEKRIGNEPEANSFAARSLYSALAQVLPPSYPSKVLETQSHIQVAVHRARDFKHLELMYKSREIGRL